MHVHADEYRKVYSVETTLTAWSPSLYCSPAWMMPTCDWRKRQEDWGMRGSRDRPGGQQRTGEVACPLEQTASSYQTHKDGEGQDSASSPHADMHTEGS